MKPCNLSEAADRGSKMKPSSSHFSPFKSKNDGRSSSKSASPSEIGASDPNTPEKPIQLRQRVRNQAAALSVKDVRKIAESLRKSNREESFDRSEKPTGSSRRTAKKIGFGSSSNLAEKPGKGSDASNKLPEKYEILAKFFDSMDCSIRLLRLKGIARTFANISRGIESLTDRRFSYNHLAQLKHILPESIVVEKVLCRDDQTLCMKPDLQVTLQVDTVENKVDEKQGSGYTNLRKLVRARLLDFYKANLEVEDIPEETLPEPFNQSKKNAISTTSPTIMPSLTVGSSSDVLSQHNSVVASHLPPFQKRFSGRVLITESKKSQLLSTSCKPSSPALSISEETNSSYGTSSSAVVSPFNPSSKLPIIREALSSDASPVKLCTSSSMGTSDEATMPMEKKDCFAIEKDQPQGTPSKVISTPARLMTSTPDLQTPKRCSLSQDDDITASPNKLLRRPPRNRPLFQTPVKNKKTEDEMNNQGRSSVDADLVNLLPEELLQSIREKEKKATEERAVGISLAKRRRQMIACLPKLFDMIHLIFQSANRCVLTKEELIHKTITNHFDIVDRNEVEEQLKLLLELVPDWISERVASSGDLLLSINKTSCPDLIRRTIAEAL